MRWRAVGAALGAVALAGAVVVLREQAPPPEAAPPPDTAPARLTPADGGLPVALPEHEPRWGFAVSPGAAFDAIASRDHIAYVRTGGGLMTFTIVRRDDDPVPTVVATHSVTTSAPWSGVLHEDVLVVAHGRRPGIELTAIDARTGAVTEIAPLDGHAFRARVAVLGDEVLVAGRLAVGPRACLLALRPRDGTQRVVWCSPDDRLGTSLVTGEYSALWPSASPQPGRCSPWSRLLEGATVPLGAAVPPALCAGRNVVDFGGWLVGARAERRGDGGREEFAIIAASGRKEVRLGAAGDVTPCGRHLYWTAAHPTDNASVVYRWRPGADHRELVLTLPGTSVVGTPRCVEGMLSVTATTPDGDGGVEVRTLGRP